MVVEETFYGNLGLAFSKSFTPIVITTGSRSTVSSRSTVERREAYPKMKLLELEAAHEKERAQEECKRAHKDVKRKRHETGRKLDLAALEFKLWDSNICDYDYQ